MDRLASDMYARGLVTAPTAEIWSSDEVAVEALGWPLKYVDAMGKSRYAFFDLISILWERLKTLSPLANS